MRRLAAPARLVCAALLLATLGAASRAAVMQAGALEISKLDVDAGGAPGFSAGGIETMAYAFAPEGCDGYQDSGLMSLSSGFYGGAGSGGPEGVGATAGPGTGGSCPSPGTRTLGTSLLGIPAVQPVCIAFNKSMLPATLQAGLKVSVLYDKDGNAVGAPATVAAQYQADPSRLVISPTVTWSSNTIYSVYLSTDALDQDGVPVASSTTFRFVTLADPTVPNTFVALDSSGTRLRVEANVLPSPGFVEINTDLSNPVTVSPSVLAAANEKFKRNHGAYGQVVSVREIDYYDQLNQRPPIVFGPGKAVLSLDSVDRDLDGVVDGTSPRAPLKTASLYALDELQSLWVRVPNSAPASGGVVSAQLPHLSVYALATSEDTDVSQAYAYPSPFRPHGPNAGNGAGQTGTEAGGITFINLPSRATVEVYNVRGERVWRGETSDGTGKLVWDARDSAGMPVASGVYLYSVRSSDNKVKVDKLGIIR